MQLAFLIILMAAILTTLYNVYPPLGGRTSRGKLRASKNFNGKIFRNQIETSMSLGPRAVVSMLREQRRGAANRQPVPPIKPEAINIEAFLAATTPQLIWLGHSSVLLRINDKTILTDPMLSLRSSPFLFAGPKRTISELPITANNLPPIDLVLISHDHYDHLDYATVSQLAQNGTTFMVPIGVAAHLRKWGIRERQITELDWWDETNTGDFKIACTPSRHFSGRRLGDRFKTLWCSWVVEASGFKFYFSGDSGYGPHFKTIGTKYGPFNLTLMECGQYNELWANIHMTPEQTVQAHLDLRGERLFPIHWGAFVLAFHPWTEPPKRAEQASIQNNIDIMSAKIGEVVSLNIQLASKPPWWSNY